jgi:hypothetical protein
MKTRTTVGRSEAKQHVQLHRKQQLLTADATAGTIPPTRDTSMLTTLLINLVKTQKVDTIPTS